MTSPIRTCALICIITITALTACTKVGLTSAPNGSSQGTFSDRPINPAADLYVITLNTPPLLETATKQGSHLVIADADKNKVLSEQTVFEQALTAIAPTAKVIYRYRMTLNAYAIYASFGDANAISNLPGVKSVAAAIKVSRPNDAATRGPATPAPFATNSVSFIGADVAHKLGFTGKGVRVGIIDTGIDYTHAMLGGSGQAGDYKADNPAQPNAAFPNAKVVGGVDLVGSDFNGQSNDPAAHLPKPDANPLDEAGHGSHVSGTVAGHGDGVNTYDGVAPDALLYAIKIFGKGEGSTADASIMAALEYAADPTGQLNPDNHLDVVNLSLGGDYGQAHTLADVVVSNLTKAGTAVVIAAGNSGPVDYIVGGPGTTDDSLSVAASIDNSPINWKFPAAVFVTPENPDLKVLLVEGPISKPVADSGNVGGKLVDIGLADKDLTPDVQAALSGNVALISRGVASFSDKLQRALAAGAIGAVIYNNDATDPFPMGGDTPVKIPAFMISQAVGLQLLKDMQTTTVTVQFNTTETIDHPEFIDTITSFSSKGPRSEDNLIKPEISAPGQAITSAAIASGNQGVMMDGTSMATPHMTGTIAVLRQAFPDLSPLELKAIAMNTAKVLTQNGVDIPITMQGAGRIQLDQAVQAVVVSATPSLSLGRVQLETSKTVKRTITLRNLTKNSLSLSVSTTQTSGMTIAVAKQVSIPAQGTVDVPVTFTLTLQDVTSPVFELDGRVFFKNGDKVVAQIPAMAIRTEASQISTAQTAAANGTVALGNSGPNSGFALAFNLIGQDASKPAPTGSFVWQNRDCDLESAGYRIISKATPTGNQDVIQFAFKIYQPVTTWYLCAVSVLIDSKGTGVADQEIAGVVGGGLDGVLKDKTEIYKTVLLDAAKARDIRVAYETAQAASPKDVSPDYKPAVLAIAPMQAYQQSTLAVIEAPLAALNLSKDGSLNVMLAAQAESGDTTESDKYLGDPINGSWFKISPKTKDQSFYGMNEITVVPSGGANLSLTRGAGSQKLVIYYPLNDYSLNHGDGQEQVLGN